LPDEVDGVLDKLLNVETLLVVAGLASAALFGLLLIRQRGIMYLVAAFFICGTVLHSHFFKVDLPGPDLTLPRLMFILILGYAFVSRSVGNVGFLPFSRLDKWMLINLLIMLASMMIFGTSSIIKTQTQPLSIFINGFLMPFVLYWVAKNFIQEEYEVRGLLWIFFLIGIYLSIMAIFEIYGPKSLVWPKFITDQTERMHLGRARGPLLNAATNGAMIIFGFISGLMLRSRSQGLSKHLITVLLLLFPLSVYLTRTRAVWLAFLVVILIMGILSPGRFLPRWRYLLVPLAILVVIAGIKAESFLSRSRAEGGVMQISPITDRVALAQVAFRMAAVRPIFGFGLGRFGLHSPRFLGKIGSMVKPTQYLTAHVQHNLLLSTLVDTGLIGVLALLFLFWIMWRYSLWLYRLLPEEGFFSKAFVVYFWAALGSYGVASMFILPSYFLVFNAQFYTLVGVVAGLYERRAPVKASQLVADRRLARRHARPQQQVGRPRESIQTG
jgi:O-antigen ligase